MSVFKSFTNVLTFNNRRPLFCFIFSSLFLSSIAHGGELKIVVNNIATTKGQIVVHLYNNEDNWMSDDREDIALEKVYVLEELSAPVLNTIADADSDKVTYQLNVSIELAPDNYSFYLFHDLDDNKELKTNWVGIPKEPITTSNMAKGFMGPPSYEDANFTIDDSTHEQVLTLVDID